MRVGSFIIVTFATLGYAQHVPPNVANKVSKTLAARTPLQVNPSNGYVESRDTGTLDGCLASKDVPVFFSSSSGFSQLAEPYNLRLVYTPAAIVVPTTNQQVADAVLCAGENDIKVQAKSGGRK